MPLRPSADLLLRLLNSHDPTAIEAGAEIARLRAAVAAQQAEIWQWAGQEAARVQREAPADANPDPYAPPTPPRHHQLYLAIGRCRAFSAD